MQVVSSAGHLKLPATLGRYQLTSDIAAGGAAVVYLGRMSGRAGFERAVAVKVLHRHLAADPTFVSSFLDEARLAAQIRHPNVVDVFDVDVIEDELVLVMEYVEGASLNFLLEQAEAGKTRIPVGIALRVVYEALLGLHAAHELADDVGQSRGLVHRDVSPHNVLIGSDGIARVTDFGIAKARGRITTTQGAGVVKGKMRYLAPEQAKGEPLDRRADIFAAGIVLWECLTMKPLFEAETDMEALYKLIQLEVRRPSEIAPGVPPAIDDVCLRALARDAVDRFSTAEEFADAIEAAAGGAMAKPREVGAYVAAAARASIDKGRDALRIRSENTPAASTLSVGAGQRLSPVSTREPEKPSRGSARVATILAVGVALGAVVTGAVLLAGPSSKGTAEQVSSARPAESAPAAVPSVTASAAPTVTETTAPPPSASASASSSAAPSARPLWGPKPTARPYFPGDL
jgi:serine/threonine-protein kinase